MNTLAHVGTFALFLLTLAWYMSLLRKESKLLKQRRELRERKRALDSAVLRHSLGLPVLEEHKHFHEEARRMNNGTH